ncbi:hypothetical protein [Methanomethylovorans sp.]|nr:hypothetical protein [Methanomethylovorans sp.]
MVNLLRENFIGSSIDQHHARADLRNRYRKHSGIMEILMSLGSSSY